MPKQILYAPSEPKIHSQKGITTMAAPLSLSLPFLALFLSVAIIPAAVAQATIANDCTSSFVTLLPCLPFVQGAAHAPAPTCCDSIRQLYNTQPMCLCFLVNDTAVGGYAINRTLAMELPTLCNLNDNISSCPGKSAPPASPGSPAVPGANKSNSSISAAPMASPTITVSPRQGLMGLGFGSAAESLKQKGDLATLVALVTILLLKLLF